MLRTYLDHNAKILEIAKQGAKKTQLVYGSYINFKLLKARLAQLIDAGLLMKEGKFYHTTPKGEVFIYHFKEIREMIPIG